MIGGKEEESRTIMVEIGGMKYVILDVDGRTLLLSDILRKFVFFFKRSKFH